MKVISDKVLSTNREISYTLIKQDEESNHLAIILLGLGYTTQAPLLHFTTGIFLNKGSDILHVNYKYSKDEFSALSEDEFTRDILSVVGPTLERHPYTNFTLVGKSMGTIGLVHLLKLPSFKSARTIWLTPLLQRESVYEGLLHSNNQGIAVIGSDDPCFIKERFEEIRNNQNVTLHLVEGANHGLELKDNILGSIDVLKDVMRIIDDF